MLSSFDNAKVVQFDLRGDKGIELLSQWIADQANNYKDDAPTPRTVSIIHWTWFHNSSDYCWSYIPDTTVFKLTSSGRVTATRASGQLDADSCVCEMDAFLEAHCTDWTMNNVWSLPEFVAALRDGDALIVKAVIKFVDLLQRHDETLHMWKEPGLCVCGRQRIFIRTFEDVEWTSD